MYNINDLLQKNTPESKKIHSELHDFIAETRRMFGETNTKGVGSFGFYLGRLRNIPVQTLYMLRAESLQPNVREPCRMFWWKIKHLNDSDKKLCTDYQQTINS